MHTTNGFGLSGVLAFCDRAVMSFGFFLLTLLLPASSMAQGVTFNFEGNEFQSYTVPADGWYFLEVLGAQGGPASNNSHQGGKGARMQGYALLLDGDELRIAVGGAGKQGQNAGNNVSGGGGGGGSSILLVNGSTYVTLLMAGGGGGAAANYNGSSGLFTQRGGPPNEGDNGKGGGIGANKYGGAGGGGFLTDGGTQFDGGTVLANGGKAYKSGNGGGIFAAAAAGSKPRKGDGGHGGWGGGGSGGPSKDAFLSNKDGGGGGGGGYSGGGGGANEGDGGGGGGSYVDASLDTTLCAAASGYRSGDGLVEITPVSGPPVIQLPADQQVAIGASVTLGPVYEDTTGQTTYQWMKDGVVLDGQTGASLNIASFKFTDMGGYQAIVQQPLATFITLPTFLSPSSPQSTLQAWGRNGDGQLGLGDATDRDTPTQATSVNDVVAVAAGGFHSLFVKRDGTLWAMGYNGDGQLGLGDTTDRKTPTQVTSDVAAVAGGSHSLFVKRDGTLWAMGYNRYGQLGLGDTAERDTPTQVPNVNDVVAVAAGGSHSLFVKRDGTLWAMGYNATGQLGLGDTGNRDTPKKVTSVTDVVAVAAGNSHSLFVKRDGTLWAMGDNRAGKLGLGDKTDRDTPTQVTSDVVAVEAGGDYSLFVKRDGTLWAMGENGLGQLGLGNSGTFKDRDTPTQVTSDVVAVAAGQFHSLFVKRDGTLWAMGDNYYGQLGLGNTTNRDTPTQVYFRDAANVATTPLIVATLPKMSIEYHSLAITAPAPAGLVLAASSDDQGGPDGIFEITFQEARTGDFAEARVVDQATGWEAEVLFWQDQEAVRFMVRFQNSSGSKKDFTAFGFFPQGRPAEIQHLALKTADLKKIGIKPSAGASNQAKYRSFQKLMNSANWEDLANGWGGFVDTIELDAAWVD